MHREGDEMGTLGMSVDGPRDRQFPSTIAKIQCWGFDFSYKSVTLSRVTLLRFKLAVIGFRA